VPVSHDTWITCRDFAAARRIRPSVALNASVMTSEAPEDVVPAPGGGGASISSSLLQRPTSLSNYQPLEASRSLLGDAIPSLPSPAAFVPRNLRDEPNMPSADLPTTETREREDDAQSEAEPKDDKQTTLAVAQAPSSSPPLTRVGTNESGNEAADALSAEAVQKEETRSEEEHNDTADGHSRGHAPTHDASVDRLLDVVNVDPIDDVALQKAEPAPIIDDPLTPTPWEGIDPPENGAKVSDFHTAGDPKPRPRRATPYVVFFLFSVLHALFPN